jgi:hypothetical protein
VVAENGSPDDSPGPADGASPEDLLAVALARGADVADAAREAGLSERTAYRRLTDPAVRARVAELRGRMVSRALGRLSEAMTAAADQLRLLLDNEDARVRLAASRALLEFSQKLHDSVELEERITALEAGRGA